MKTKQITSAFTWDCVNKRNVVEKEIIENEKFHERVRKNEGFTEKIKWMVSRFILENIVNIT